MKIQSPWNLEIAHKASIDYALTMMPKVIFLRTYGFWIIYVPVSLFLLALNWPFQGTFQIGEMNLSYLLTGFSVVFLLGVAYLFSIFIENYIAHQWKESLLNQLKPWQEEANGTKIYSTSKDGLRIEGPVSTHIYSWKAVSSIQTGRDFVFVIAYQQMLAAIPISAFESQNQIGEFIKDFDNYSGNPI